MLALCSMSSVNQSDASQSWAPERLRMQKWADSVFLRVGQTEVKWEAARNPIYLKKKERKMLIC